MSISNILEGSNNYVLKVKGVESETLNLSSEGRQMIFNETNQTTITVEQSEAPVTILIADPLVNNSRVVMCSSRETTQITSSSNAVVIHACGGQILTVPLTLVQNARTAFQVNNSYVTEAKNVFVTLLQYGDGTSTILSGVWPIVSVSGLANGSFKINILNYGETPLNDALRIGFIVT